MPHDVLLLSSLRPAAHDRLGAEFRLWTDAEATPELRSRVRAVVAAGGKPVGRDFLAAHPAVGLIAVGGVGYDAVDVGACAEMEIAVTNTPGVLTDDVADIALMLLLAVRRNLIRGDAHVRSGAWGRMGPIPLTSRIAGLKAGIVGLGRIGNAIARRCQAIGMEIGYTARSARAAAAGPYFPDAETLATWADVLIVAVPGGPGTQNIINARVIAALGPEGTFINIARGSVVDEPALIRALASGALGSAGLDVFWNEPTPDPALTSLPNVTLYPHHASGTDATRDAMDVLVADNLIAFFAGRPLLSQVAPPPGAKGR